MSTPHPPTPRDQALSLLEAHAAGQLGAPEALRRLEALLSGADLGHTRVDLGRAARTGRPEVIFGQGKSASQIIDVLSALHAAGQDALATRVDAAKAAEVCAALPAVQHAAAAQLLFWPVDGRPPAERARHGHVVVACAGTSDLPVAEEAAITLELLGNRTTRVVDVGVAGLHRLLARVDLLRSARAVVVVAGMEGALPSVVAGLVARPVIAVPTSIGYGAHLQGLTPLMAMLTSCATGLAVVNIDNGFGAGVMASLINHGDIPDADAT